MKKLNKEKLFELFIGMKKTPLKTGKTLEWYRSSFEKCDVSGGFAWKWCWGAFIGSYLYLLYRKCYLEGISYFIVVFILGGVAGKYMPQYAKMTSSSIVFMIILSGGLLHNVVYRRYLKSKTLVEVKPSEEERTKTMESLGGTDKRAVIIGIVAYLVVNGILNIK